MPKFRKKPVVVEAMQFTEETKDRCYQEISPHGVPDFEDGKPILKVQTVHGEIAIVRLGDWIIPDAKPGTYYPCKPNVFEKTYEPVEEDN